MHSEGNGYEYSNHWQLCGTKNCWCKATVKNSTYVKIPYSIMEDIVENGFTNIQSLDFLSKAFEEKI